MTQDFTKLITGARNMVVERCRKRIEDAKNNDHKETHEEAGITSILKRKHGL